MVWMELAMFALAWFGYLLFNGGLPLSRTVKKVVDEEQPPEAEKVARELQAKLATGDYLASYKLWQRAKSCDQALSNGVLLGAVEAMRKLGKPVDAISAEFRSAFECNDALQDRDSIAEAIVVLQKEGEKSTELCNALSDVLRAPSAQKQAGNRSLIKARQSTQASVASALRRGNLEEAFQHLDQLAGVLHLEQPESRFSRELLARFLSLAGREHRLSELGDRLVSLSELVTIDVRTLNELLEEATRRRDSVLFRQIHILANKMQLAKDARTYELLVRGLSSDAKTVETLFAEAEANPSIVITDALVLSLLAACAASRNAKFGWRVFQAVGSTSGKVPDHAIFVALIKLYNVCGLHADICDVYEQQMVTQKVKPDPQLADLIFKSATQAGRSALSQSLFEGSAGDINRHISVIRACGREGNLNGAQAAFERLRDSGVEVTPRVHNTLLDACVQCRNTTRALELFAEMKASGTTDVVSFNIILKLFLRDNKLAEAQRLMKEMTEHGFDANKVTYNEMLNAMVKSNNMPGAWELLQDMVTAHVRPSAVTCSILLKTLTRTSSHEDIDRTMALLDQMEEQMDEVLFASVIEACVRIGRLDALATQTRRFAAHGGLLSLSPQTYGSLFKAYGQARDVERLWDLWNQMEQRQVRPTSITLGCFVDALVNNRRAEDAWDLVSRFMKDPSRADLVNNIIYSTLLKGFAMTKQADRLFAVYSEMRACGTAVNTITYNTLFDACARCGCMDRAPELVADMRALGVAKDTITYSTLVKGHCFAGDLDSAFTVLKEMRSETQRQPDEIMYNSLLDGCAKEHRVEEALALYEEMKKEKVRPSNYTLCTLVKLLGRVRQLPQAFAFVEQFKAAGLRPNIQVYTCLMSSCIESRQLERALQLHDQVLAAGLQPDEKMYNALVRGCLRGGNLSKASEVVRCAYLLPGHRLVAPGCAYGVDMRVVEEVVMKLNQGGKVDVELARGLVADLKQYHGLNIQDNVYVQVVQRATRR